MLKIQNKSTKRIRVVQIILFLIQIVLTSTPFVWSGAIDPTKTQSTYTVLDMISYIGASTGNGETERMLNILGVCYILFLVIPIVAVCFQIFDRFYNLKNVAGLICSGVGVVLIIYFVGSYLCFGSLLAMLFYLLSFFMSVMGIFARYLNVENTADKAPK